MHRGSTIAKSKRNGILLAATAGCLIGNLAARGATWTSTVNGTWTVATNWLNGVIPNASGAVADFSTLDLTQDMSVALNGNKTIGAIIFGDTVPSNNWTLTGNQLIFADPSVTPTFTVNGTTNVTLSGTTINNSQGIIKLGTGRLLLSPNNATNAGNWFINQGTLAMDNTGRANAAPGGFIMNGGVLQFTVNQNSPTATRPFLFGPATGSGSGTIDLPSGITFTDTTTTQFSNQGTGTGSLVKTGAGTMTLGVTATYSGSTTILGGALNANFLANGGLGSPVGNSSNAASNLVIDGGSFQYNGTGSSSTDRLFSIGTNGGTLASNSGTANFTNTGAVGYTNPGTPTTLSLAGAGVNANTLAASIGNNGAGAVSVKKEDGGLWILTGTSTYTGDTTVNNGTLALTGAFNSGGNIVVNGGAFQIGNGGTTGNIGNKGITLNGGALVFNRSDSVLFGNIVNPGGGGGITQAGTGTVTLPGNYTFSGDTNVNSGALAILGSVASNTINVNGGTLRVSGSTNPSGNVNINSTGALTGTGTLGNVTLNGGSSLRPGPAATDGSVGSINFGTLNVNGGAVLRLDLVTPANADRINVAGQVNFSGGTITLTSIPSAGTYTIVSSGLNINYGSMPTFDIPTGTRSVFTPDTTTDPTKLLLGVQGASKSLFWTGLNGSTWDVVGVPAGNPGVTNWTDNTIDEKFFNLDTVTFGDSTTTHGAVSNYAVVVDGQVNPNSTIFNNSVGDYTISGAGGITGAGGIVKNGTAKAILTTNNTNTGSTQINAGTLYIGNGGNTGSIGTGDVIDNANLVFARNDQITFANNVTGTGIVRNEGNTVLLTGSSSFGSAVIASGTIQIGDGNTVGDIGATPISGAGTLSLNRSDTLNVASPISGSVTVFQSGAGTSILTANNTYSGSTVINQGTLQIGNGGTTGSLGSGDAQVNATLNFNRSDAITVNNGFAGGGTVRQVGGNTLTITNAAGFGGTFAVANGTLRLGSSTAFPNGGRIILGGAGNTAGTFDLGGFSAFVSSLATTGSGANAITNSGANTATLTSTGDGAYGGTIRDGGAGTGTVALVVSNGSLALNGSNSYTGGTNITGGTLQIGNGNALGTGSVNNSSALVLNGNLTLSTVINGSGQLYKQGNNTATLAANNTFTGPTNLQGGTLVFSSLSNLGASTNIIFDGGTLRYGTGIGNLDISAARMLTFNAAGGTIDTNGNDVTFTQSIGNNGPGGFTKAGDGTLTLNAVNNYAGSTSVIGGKLVLAAGATLGNTTSQLNLGAGTTTGSLDLTSNNLTVGSLTAQSNSSGANVLTIASGKTLTVTNAALIGGLTGTTTSTVQTILNVQGAGATLIIGNGSGGSLSVNNNSGSANQAASFARLDVSPLQNFTANFGASGTIAVGVGSNGAASNGPGGQLILANTNALNAGTLIVAHAGTNGGFNTLLLGATNDIAADNILIAAGKGGGAIFFNSGLTNPTVNIHGTAGPTARVQNVKVGDYSDYASGGASTNSQGSLNFVGGTVTALVGNLSIGVGRVSGQDGGTGSAAGTLTFDKGTIDVSTLTVGATSGSSLAGGSAVGTIIVGGTGHLIVNNATTLGSPTNGAATFSGAMIINGGSASLATDIASSGNSTITLNAGSLDMSNHSIGGANIVGVINIAGGAAANVHQFNVNTLNATAGNLTIVPGRDVTKTSIVHTALNVNGGKVDVNDNDLVWDYTGGADPAKLTTVRTAIAAGYANGAWTGNGLTSGAAAVASTSAHPTALGYAEAATTGLPSFDTIPTDGDMILVRYTYAGDATLDGTVNNSDFTALGQNFGSVTATWSQGDSNYDGVINALDFNAIATNFGQTLPSAPVLGSLVPEPATISLLLTGSLLVRRRRNKVSVK